MPTDLQIDTTLRNVDLQTLTDLLREQQDVKVDEVVPASRLKYVNGRLHIVNGAYRIDESGVTEHDAVLNPTPIFEDGVSARLEIPRQYLRRLRETAQAVTVDAPFLNADGEQFDGPLDVALLDANVNGWLQAQGDKPYLVRSFRTDNPDVVGIARSLNSNKFGILDHLDLIVAAFKGVKEAGIAPDSLRITGNLSEYRLRLLVSAPEIYDLAPDLVGGYRSPFSGRSGADLPVVFAGVVLGNSETGNGRWTVTPRVTFEICDNGATITKDVVDGVHLGARLEEGVVRWSEETQRKNLDLIVAKARDAVTTFLDKEYIRKVLDDLREQYDVPVRDAVATITRVAKKHLFTEEEQASILDMFIQGGQATAGGVFQAVTAAAQNIDDPDRAAEFEDLAVDVLATAASDR